MMTIFTYNSYTTSVATVDYERCAEWSSASEGKKMKIFNKM